MSRIGNTPISIPAGVSLTVADGRVVVKGPKGELSSQLVEGVQVQVADGQVIVSRTSDERQIKANHGLIRSLINNDIQGVTQGYQKTLKLIGTGYRVTQKGKNLSLTLGFSHPIEIEAPESVTLSVEGNDTIFVAGISKQLVGQVAANIRAKKPPEPYKGKGIRYEGEVVKRKAGKAAA